MICDKWLHIYSNKLGTGVNCEWVDDVRENVRGKWWHEPHTNNTWVQRCSNCFHVAMITGEEECPYNYCPICGADMRGGQHEKDN